MKPIAPETAIETLCLDSNQQAEGGYTTRFKEGPTNYGIVQRSLDNLVAQGKEVPVTKVEDLTPAMARDLLLRYWLRPTRVCELPEPLALVHSHMVIMSWDNGVAHLRKRMGMPGETRLSDAIIQRAHQACPIQQSLDAARDVQSFLHEFRNHSEIKGYLYRFNKLV